MNALMRLLLGIVAALFDSKAQPATENALLLQQLWNCDELSDAESRGVARHGEPTNSRLVPSRDKSLPCYRMLARELIVMSTRLVRGLPNPG